MADTLDMCTNEAHDAIKADPVAWSTLKHIGDQPVRASANKPGYVLEMRNCSCGSTLAVKK